MSQATGKKGDSFTVRESGKGGGVTVTLQVSPEARQG
jgi:hypothetical protein